MSLADYRGRSSLFLALERGLFCPFCRTHIAQLDRTKQKLEDLDVEILAVFGTPRPIPIAADLMHTRRTGCRDSRRHRRRRRARTQH